jgi:hypothetical protein
MSWQGMVATIAASGGAGAFIDFWIGKAGQAKVRGWLETWWIRFSYVNSGNSGREEALFAVSVLDRVYGSRPFSRRRLLFVALTTVSTSLLLMSYLLL